jgi:hypothetical protein
LQNGLIDVVFFHAKAADFSAAFSFLQRPVLAFI